jgi:hypothetical protein
VTAAVLAANSLPAQDQPLRQLASSVSAPTQATAAKPRVSAAVTSPNHLQAGGCPRNGSRLLRPGLGRTGARGAGHVVMTSRSLVLRPWMSTVVDASGNLRPRLVAAGAAGRFVSSRRETKGPLRDVWPY